MSTTKKVYVWQYEQWWSVHPGEWYKVCVNRGFDNLDEIGDRILPPYSKVWNANSKCSRDISAKPGTMMAKMPCDFDEDDWNDQKNELTGWLGLEGVDLDDLRREFDIPFLKFASFEAEMSQRQFINMLAAMIYKSHGSVVQNPDPLYFFRSQHPTEIGCLALAEEIFSIFWGDTPDYSDDELDEEVEDA